MASSKSSRTSLLTSFCSLFWAKEKTPDEKYQQLKWDLGKIVDNCKTSLAVSFIKRELGIVEAPPAAIEFDATQKSSSPKNKKASSGVPYDEKKYEGEKMLYGKFEYILEHKNSYPNDIVSLARQYHFVCLLEDVIKKAPANPGDFLATFQAFITRAKQEVIFPNTSLLIDLQKKLDTFAATLPKAGLPPLTPL